MHGVIGKRRKTQLPASYEPFGRGYL